MSPFDWRGTPSAIAAEMQPSKKVRIAPGVALARPVEQLSRTGEVIQTFPSASVASKAVGVPDSNIGRAAGGKRATAGGFRWRYVAFGGAYSKAQA